MNKKNMFLYMLAICVLPTLSFSQAVKTFSFVEIDSLQEIERRNLAVFIHADWCMYCQAMKNRTFKNKDVINLLNNYYYFVDFNAQTKKEIIFNGTEFNFEPTGKNIGYHKLAYVLGSQNGQLIFPGFVVLNWQNEIIFQYNSYIAPAEMKLILNRLNAD
ncbi:MAG TPA: thioredoxin fold domain-containing protein [Flavobacteriaceae bacterium]|nr:thioredoxin fold domain-containing protein [Flavobacteriaceae bacterium]